MQQAKQQIVVEESIEQRKKKHTQIVIDNKDDKNRNGRTSEFLVPLFSFISDEVIKRSECAVRVCVCVCVRECVEVRCDEEK